MLRYGAPRLILQGLSCEACKVTVHFNCAWLLDSPCDKLVKRPDVSIIDSLASTNSVRYHTLLHHIHPYTMHRARENTAVAQSL